MSPDLQERVRAFAAAQHLSDAEAIVRLVGEGLLSSLERRPADARPRVEAAAAWRTLAEATNDFLWAVDVSAGPDVEPAPWGDRLHPDDAERVRTSWKAAIRGHDDTWWTWYRWRRDDGAYVLVLDRGRIERDDTGRALRAVGGGRDIDAWAAADAQRHQRVKMETVGRFSGSIAHAFNNLLTIILGHVELGLETLPSDAPLRTSLTEIQQAAEEAASVSRQLGAISRRQGYQPRVLDLNALVQEVLVVLRRLIGDQVEVVFHASSAASAITADPGQIEQLLINLAIFARQEMPNGGRWTVDTANVRLDEPFAATHATVKPGPHVRLVLTDTGVGLDKETLQHIFDPSSAKAHGRLAGLSAISAYNIVKQSGGSIWVESDVGRGTRLTIYFPQTDATVEPPAPAPAHAVTQEARVLVVDDEAALRALAAQILARAGYSVRLAASAKEALVELAQASPKFDLLVTDIMMPEMSGTALAVRAIEQQPDLKIMYVSGHVGEGSLASGPIPSGVPFLSKPYSARQLTETARAALAAAREA